MNDIISTYRTIKALFLASAVLLVITFCTRSSGTSDTETDNVVEVRATHDSGENRHLFEISRKEIPAGWNTFRFENASPADHFFMFYRVPEEAITASDSAGEPLLDHWFQGVTEPFQVEFNPYINGEIDYGTFADNLVAAILEKAPWFFDPGAPPMGGPGLTAVGRTSETTVHLDTGTYIVECYVKDADEQFHSYLGMLEMMTVTEDTSETVKPEPTETITISSTDGIAFNEDLSAGKHIFEILFEDQTTYSHMMGHNVQLVKLNDMNDDELLADLGAWMDWSKPGMLSNRAPSGAEFLGGVMDMTEGASAYYHVELEPGDYAWIAEVPDPVTHGMLKTFTVTD